MEIIIPPCSSNDQISKDIYSFLYKQGNHIPISLKKSMSQSGGGFYDDFSRFMDNLTSSNKEEKEEPSVPSNININNDNDNVIKTKEENIPTSNTTNTNTTTNNSILLDFNICSNNNEEKCTTKKKYTLENIKGTKLYFLISRNGECARWV